MLLTHYQYHAGNVRPAPIHHASIDRAPVRPVPVSLTRLETRSGSATMGSPRALKRLIDNARRASRNNAQAVMLVKNALPIVKRIEANFPGRPFTITAAVPGPSQFLDSLDNACQRQSPSEQGWVRLDMMGLRLVDQSLRAFGIQFAERYSGEESYPFPAPPV